MKRKVSFYKENGSWYADVPLVPKSSNLMVAGADKFLDHIKKREGKVLLNVIVNPNKNDIKKCKYILHRVDHDFWGGKYGVWTINGKENNIKEFYENLWLCNVTHFVLGRHPIFIGITEIE